MQLIVTTRAHNAVTIRYIKSGMSTEHAYGALHVRDAVSKVTENTV